MLAIIDFLSVTFSRDRLFFSVSFFPNLCIYYTIEI
nr:MAG TPA: hypothetical protein [Caudoviricetes sp.]DAU52126.1 MAG TPA: hypothetical protein [Caudoviricetes sp.]